MQQSSFLFQISTLLSRSIELGTKPPIASPETAEGKLQAWLCNAIGDLLLFWFVWSPGQARVNKLEEQLTNALEVARVAEAAAARQKIWCFSRIVESTFCATGFIPGQQCNCHGGEAGSLARGLQATVCCKGSGSQWLSDSHEFWQGAQLRAADERIQDLEQKESADEKDSSGGWIWLEGFVRIGACGSEFWANNSCWRQNVCPAGSCCDARIWDEWQDCLAEIYGFFLASIFDKDDYILLLYMEYHVCVSVYIYIIM